MSTLEMLRSTYNVLSEQLSRVTDDNETAAEIDAAMIKISALADAIVRAPRITVTFKREELNDDSPDLSYLEQDYKGCAQRLAAYQRGDWHMIGIRAVATIWVQHDSYRTYYEISSPGLWGIESDSEESHLDSVFKDECSILQADIAAMGAAEFKI